MSTVDIPDPLLNSILGDQAILFLGAGASKGARNGSGEEPPSGDHLKEMICDKFLGGKLKNRPLAEISDYAINETDLPTLQAFIHSIFKDFQPCSFHKLIPLFPWYSIVTTNYDLIIERAYSDVAARSRDLEVFVKNGDKIDSKLGRNHNSIGYLKLHGCISHYQDTSIPLILSHEQYFKYGTNRDRLFQRFRDLGYQFNIIFTGYSINDPNIRNILFDLTDLGIERPRYYLVSPSVDEYQRRYWETKRFTVLDATLEVFMQSLRARTSNIDLGTAQLQLPGTTSLNKFYKTSAPVESKELIAFLASDVTHVRPGMAVASQSPKQFYSGYDQGWGPLEQQLDVYRDIEDSIQVEAVLKPLDKKTGVHLYVIKGAAGNGKTVALKRVSWDAANDYEQIVLFHEDGGALNGRCIQEIHDLTGKRLILSIDHIALLVEEAVGLIEYLRNHDIPCTIIATERDNEWNVRCEPLEKYLTNEFSIGYLSPKEIGKLIDKLAANKCLGELEAMTPEKRYSAFALQAQRQLLVALHEVTLGIPFENIIRDEYERIIPEEAKLLYLDICSLNRFGVSVRAGLIARISGISFETFEKKLFEPLELLIQTSKHPYLHDHLYQARHPHIAELVFNQAFNSPELKYEQITRVIKGLNIDYSSDNDAFYSLIRGRTIADTFPAAELGRRVFALAHQVAKASAFVSQQEAVFEMAHREGNLIRAQKALETAAELAPWDRTIQHTMANLLRRSAMNARTPLEKTKLRGDAKALLGGLLDGNDEKPYGLYTYTQLLVDELEELLTQKTDEKGSLDSNSTSEDRRIADILKDVEKALWAGVQRFPKSEQFLLLEERFLTLINSHRKAERALQRAFDANPRNEYIATRLAQKYVRAERIPDAEATLRRCLENNPGSKLAHLKMALLYMQFGDKTRRVVVLDHLRKSFSDGDDNRIAQFWYARELFLLGRYSEAKELFERLYESRMAPGLRHEVRGEVRDENKEIIRYNGSLVTFESSFGFVKSASFGSEIFVQSRDSSEEEWSKLQRNSHVEFELVFTMRGPRGRRVKFLR